MQIGESDRQANTVSIAEKPNIGQIVWNDLKKTGETKKLDACVSKYSKNRKNINQFLKRMVTGDEKLSNKTVHFDIYRIIPTFVNKAINHTQR